MNHPGEEQIENLLRHSPKPAPPQGLKEKLIVQTQSAHRHSPSSESLLTLAQRSWWQRWWPALVPAGLSLACMVVVAGQQVQIQQLKQSIQALSAGVTTAPASATQTTESNSAGDSSANDAQEIARLKEVIGQLTAEIAQLEKLRAENQSLRTQLAAPPTGLFTQEETDALAKARERAERIACVNNLKQVAISVFVWAGDQADVAPPDLLSMTNELGSPKILVCPGDHGRQVASNFPSFTAANCSYEYLIAGSTNWKTEPTRVMTRCPIHGTVGLCDGSVQQVNTNRSDLFYERDGKLYFGRPGQ